MSRKDVKPSRRGFLRFPIIGNSLLITRTQEKSEPDKIQVREKNALDDLLESSFPPVRSFDGEKRPYEFRYPNSKRSLIPFELTPRTLCCIDNVKMGAKTGAIIGSIFGGINGTYHALKYKNYMSVPIFAIGGAISFGFFLGCGMIVRCQPMEIPSRSIPYKYSQAIFPIYFKHSGNNSLSNFNIRGNAHNFYDFEDDSSTCIRLPKRK